MSIIRDFAQVVALAFGAVGIPLGAYALLAILGN